MKYSRLADINRTAFELRFLVDQIHRKPGDKFDFSELDSIRQRIFTLTSRSTITMRRAETVQTDATVSKIQAESLLEEINIRVTKEATDAVNYIKLFLRNMTQGGHINIDQMIREAEHMLYEIKSKDFNTVNITVRIEFEKAVDALRRAKDLMDKAMGQVNRTTIISLYLLDILNKLGEIQNFSRQSMSIADVGSRLNINLNQLKIHLTETVQLITKLQVEIRGCLDKSSELLEKARNYIRDARRAYIEAERELTRLDQATIRIRIFIDELSRENVLLVPLVQNATEHALKLKKQADFLDSLIIDTRIIAERAIRASKAYQDIIDAINRALNASLAAIAASEEAIDLSRGHGEDARLSRERSERIKIEADFLLKQIEIDLRLRLQNVKYAIEEWTKRNIRIKETITELVIGMDMLPEGGFSDKAHEAAEIAINSQRRAEEAESKVTVIIDHLKVDQARIDQIPIDIAEANRNIRQAQIQVDEVTKLVPTTINLLDRLHIHASRIRQLGMNLAANITILRNEVLVARTVANLIRVGMHYQEDTSLQVRNPFNILTSGAISKVSIYFTTKHQNGLLFYVGPDNEHKQTDYMALEIIDGQAVFKFDLGSGPAIIINSKLVGDGKWHEAIVQRTGNKGTLTIRTADEVDQIAEGSSNVGSSILNLDENTKFYVGGIPNRLALRNILSNSRFIGCIEDIKFDDIVVGLWNFVYADRTGGCQGRDTLYSGYDTGFMFNGNGYVILSKDRFKPEAASQVKFTFKTLARDGLMFLIGSSNHHYLSVEMQDGHVLFQFDLGSGRANLTSPQIYNNGEWHTVLASRNNQDGILKVDGNTVASARSPGNLKELEMDNFIYIGGFKGKHLYQHVTIKGFEGCIKDLQLGPTVRDMNENIEVKDVLPGCREAAHVVSFMHEVTDSYIAMDSYNIDNNFDMSLKLKTQEQDGLLMYLADDTSNQQNSFSLSVVGGKIFLVHVSDGKRTEKISSFENYNDGRWHYISIQKSGKDILFLLDDVETIRIIIDGKERLLTTSPLYIGGVPSSYTIVNENVGTRTHFVGCVGDVTINSLLLDFSKVSVTNQNGAIIGSCYLVDPTPTPRTFTFPTLPTARPSGEQREKCILPLEPKLLFGDVKTDEGTQFGLRRESRHEYIRLPVPDISNRAAFSIEFKTLAAQGIIFYISNEKLTDFIALYINNGQVSFAFNCGTGIGSASTSRLYNDGKWHKATFSRNQNEGSLTLDESEILSFNSAGSAKTIETDKPYYVGGLPSHAVSAASGNMEKVTTGFIGCVRNIKLDNMDLGPPAVSVGTQSCSSATELGVFFKSSGGYLSLYDNFSVPLDLDISLMIKPRRLSGVLFSVYHNQGQGLPGGDYLVLQMINGDLFFSMDNGDGDVSAIYVPPAKNGLCDGEWHLIKAQKAKNVITLEVDNITTSPGIAGPGIATTNTKDPLYIGGVPELHRGIRTTDTYAGCIRDLFLANKPQDLNRAQVMGAVDIGSCPTQ